MSPRIKSIMAVLSLVLFALMYASAPSASAGAYYITDEVMTTSPGNDQITYTATPAYSWIADLRMWAVNYQPTGPDDSTNLKPYVVVDQGRGPVVSKQIGVTTKSAINSALAPPDGTTVYYTFYLFYHVYQGSAISPSELLHRGAERTKTLGLD